MLPLWFCGVGNHGRTTLTKQPSRHSGRNKTRTTWRNSSLHDCNDCKTIQSSHWFHWYSISRWYTANYLLIINSSLIYHWYIYIYTVMIYIYIYTQYIYNIKHIDSSFQILTAQNSSRPAIESLRMCGSCTAPMALRRVERSVSHGLWWYIDMKWYEYVLYIDMYTYTYMMYICHMCIYV